MQTFLMGKSIFVPSNQQYALFAFSTPKALPFLSVKISPNSNATTSIGLVNQTTNAGPPLQKIGADPLASLYTYLWPRTATTTTNGVVTGSSGAATLENGAPLLDTSGDLVGIQVIDNNAPVEVPVTSDLQTSLVTVNRLMNTTTPTLAGYWNNGMDYFYQQHQYAQAQAAFNNAKDRTLDSKQQRFLPNWRARKCRKSRPQVRFPTR